MKKLVLIDTHALVHRAFHALPPMNAPDGRASNAVYGFTSVLLKMLADLKPDYIAAASDLPGGTFRDEQYKDYKGTRAKAPDELYAQIPMVKEMLAAFGIPVFEQKGFEADDVIGTIAAQTREMSDLQTVIVTSDLDTLQLIYGKQVVVFTLRKGMSDTVTYDEAAMRKRYGITPSQVPDLKGLKGDASDNIKGVAGIGEKTALALIGAFKSVEGVLKAAQAKKLKKPLTEKLAAKLRDGHQSATLSKQLATIRTDVPISFSLQQADWHTRADAATIETLCKQFGFYSLAKRIASTLSSAVAKAASQSLDLDSIATPLTADTTPADQPSDLPEAPEAAVHAVIAQGTIAALYITTDGEITYDLVDPTLARAQEVLHRYPTLVGHDIKELLRILPNPASFTTHTIVDTAIGAWLANPQSREYSLERVCYELAGQSLSPDHPWSWPVAIWHLRPLVIDAIGRVDMMKIFTDMEMPLVPVLAAMEHLGIRVNAHTIDDLLATATHEVGELEGKIYKLAGEEFNINSPSQLADILFTKLAIRGRVRRTGTGRQSTAADELEKLHDEHPIIELILQYRELSKLKNTYIEPFPSLIATDGRIHTTYNQAGAATGRLSSNNPNLQNIPTRTELGNKFRGAFIADPAYRLVSLDYSQLELRLVAHIAQDQTMLEAFRNGEDIHTRTASEVFGVAPAAVTRDMRRQAKVLNFGLIYGMGSLGFARTAGMSRDQAKQFIQEYFTRFPGVAAYMERTKKEAYRDGYVSTLWGRRRPLPDITSTMPQLAAAAERMAINHPVQGSGADLIKLAMVAVGARTRQTDWQGRVRMLLTVHDELVLEVHADLIEEVAHEARGIMERVYQLDVPIIVDVKVGDSWANMTVIER